MEYSYEIVSVNPAENNMLVKFIAKDKNREEVITGTPLPTEGISLEDFLHPYAPIGYWIEKERPKVIPEIGVKGEYSSDAYEKSVAEKFRKNIEEYNTTPEVQVLREIQEQAAKDLITQVLEEKGLIT